MERFSTIPIKIPSQFKEDYSNSYGKIKKRIFKTMLCNNRLSGGFIISDFKLYYRGIPKLISWFWHKNRGGSM